MTPVSRRRLQAVATDTALALLAAFYLFAPTVYAYFSEVGMSYAHVPKWFAATPPAALTARIFSDYNSRAPRAVRFQRQLACFLRDVGSKRKPGCMHELHAGQSATGPDTLKIAAGRYVARFDFAGLDGCDIGETRLEVTADGRFGRVLARYTGTIRPGDHLELPFHVRMMEAALAPIEFRVDGLSGCVVLGHVDWAPAPHAALVASR